MVKKHTAEASLMTTDFIVLAVMYSPKLLRSVENILCVKRSRVYHKIFYKYYLL